MASHSAADGTGPSIKGARTYAHGTSSGAVAAVSCGWPAIVPKVGTLAIDRNPRLSCGDGQTSTHPPPDGRETLWARGWVGRRQSWRVSRPSDLRKGTGGGRFCGETAQKRGAREGDHTHHEDVIEWSRRSPRECTPLDNAVGEGQLGLPTWSGCRSSTGRALLEAPSQGWREVARWSVW